MRNFLLLSAFAVLLTSCVTREQYAYKTVKVHTTAPSTIIRETDTIRTKNNMAKVVIRKNSGPQTISATSGNRHKTITLQPIVAFEDRGFGIVPLFFKQKNYTYPSNIYLNTADTSDKYYTYNKFNRKGELLLQLSGPFMYSAFFIHTTGEKTKSSQGAFGVGAGLTYYYHNNRFISLSFNAATDRLGETFGGHDITNSTWWALSNNHRIDRFSIGYGLVYAHNTWKYAAFSRDSTAAKQPDINQTARVLGLVVPVSYQAGHNFYIGASYRPTFINLASGGTSRYEHVINIELAWKIRLKRGTPSIR